MCGGDIHPAENQTYGTCDHCGNTMTLPSKLQKCAKPVLYYEVQKIQKKQIYRRYDDENRLFEASD